MARDTVSERRRAGPWRRLVPALAPLVVGSIVLTAWELSVWWWEIPRYLLPGPMAIGESIGANGARLTASWAITFGTMLVALAAAVVTGVMLAVVFTASRVVELSLFPYAITLQVTPLVAVAPLLVIWIDDPWLVRLICAWIVAFFPILSNTVIGLRSADSGLRDLFTIYGATTWQRIHLLLVPSALPFFLAGLKVAVNLALIGAVVAEFVTGAATDHPGLASLVFEGQETMDIGLTFAALTVISLTGIATYFATHLLSIWLLSNWHASSTNHQR